MRIPESWGRHALVLSVIAACCLLAGRSCDMGPRPLSGYRQAPENEAP